MEPAELPEHVERVLDVAEGIPAARVLTYGDIAELLREEDAAVPAGDGAGPAGVAARGVGGPRQVGRVMALYGGVVPWWRVVRADGRLLPGSESRALERYRAEGTPLREAAHTDEGYPRLDMPRARWRGEGG